MKEIGKELPTGGIEIVDKMLICYSENGDLEDCRKTVLVAGATCC